MSSHAYRSEYAKSGKASCKGCKQSIEKQSLRLAIMVQVWACQILAVDAYSSLVCYSRPFLTESSQIGFTLLVSSHAADPNPRMKLKISKICVGRTKRTYGEGLVRILLKEVFVFVTWVLDSGSSGSVVDAPTKSKGKSRKRTASTDPSLPADINDYVVEYAKSSRAKCKVCEENIQKNEVRISKKDFESETAKKYGPVDRWHHLKCFLLARDELNFTAAGSVLPGFKTLEPEDQKKLKDQIPAK